MRLSSGFRAALIALVLAAGALASPAHADGGSISFRVLKGGWVIGASGGSGTLVFHGHRGVVRNIRSPYDVSGVYGAAGAGAAIGAGGQAIVLTNDRGAVLELTGFQVGLQVNVDLSGLSISVR